MFTPIPNPYAAWLKDGEERRRVVLIGFQTVGNQGYEALCPVVVDLEGGAIVVGRVQSVEVDVSGPGFEAFAPPVPVPPITKGR